MGLLFRSLCFVFFLHETISDLGEDVVFDILSDRLDYVSLTLAKIARKQKDIERNIEINAKLLSSNKEHAQHSDTGSDSTENGLVEELTIIKNAISSEKEFVRNQIDFLEKKFDAIATSNPLLDNNRRISQTQFADQIESVDLTGRMQMIETEFKTFKSLANKIADRMDKVETSLDSLDSVTQFLVDSMHSTTKVVIENAEKKVSFFAQFMPPPGAQAAIIGGNKVIPFEHVIYNEGSGFNATRGVFTVPISGVYQFVFFVEGWLYKEGNNTCPTAIVQLVVDHTATESYAYAEPWHLKQHIQAGNQYINYLRKGQEVTIGTSFVCEEHTIFGYRTSFSGVLLH